MKINKKINYEKQSKPGGVAPKLEVKLVESGPISMALLDFLHSVWVR